MHIVALVIASALKIEHVVRPSEYVLEKVAEIRVLVRVRIVKLLYSGVRREACIVFVPGFVLIRRRIE